MDFQVHEQAGVTVVALLGEHLDASNSKEFRRAVGPALALRPQVVFDLSAVRFVDSSGCGVLLSCLREVGAGGDPGASAGKLALCGISPPVRSLFELVRMHKVFEIYDARDAAVAALNRPPDPGRRPPTP